MSRTSGWLSATALTAAVVAASGCGGGSSVDPVASAATKTGRVAGADVAGSVTISNSQLGRGITLPIGGVFSLRKRSGSMTMDFSSLSSLAGGRLGKGADARMQLLFVSPVIYMHAPFLSKQLPGGKTWLKIDLGATSRQLLGSTPAGLGGNQDPTQQLDYLRATSAKGVTKVGSERIRGVETTHYHALVDLDKYVNLVPPSQHAQARQGIARLEQLTGRSTYPVDVWIDAQHRIRRVRQVQSQQRNGQQTSETETLDYFNFGPKPAVAPPPASSVYDATARVLRQLG